MTDTAFFSTAAQVIPVFALALVVEYRYFSQPEDEAASRSLFQISFLIALAGGEWLALGALTDNAEPSDFDRLVVSAALAWGLLGLFLPLLIPRARLLERRLEGHVPPRLLYHAKTAAFLLFIALTVTATVVDAVVIGAAVAALWFVTLIGSWILEGQERRAATDDSADTSPDVARTPAGAGRADRD